MNTFIHAITNNIIHIPNIIWARKKEKKVLIPFIFIVLFLLSMVFVGGSSVDVFTYTVEPKEFIQKVSLTGKVIAAKNVDMAFETSARVEKVYVNVGDAVKKGTVLAYVSNGDYASVVQKNYAIVQSEQAKLQDLSMSSKDAEIRLAQDNIVNAEASLAVSQQSLLDQIRDVYVKMDDAIRFGIDPSFRDPRSQNPQFIYNIDQNDALKKSIESERIEIGRLLAHVNDSFSIDKLTTYREEIYRIQKFINNLNTAISIVSEKSNSSGDATYIAQVLSQKTSISSARTTFSLALTSLNQSELAYKNNLSSLTQAKNQLQILNSSATPSQLAIQRANIQSAQASVGNATAQLEKTIIRAPFDGVITKVDIKEGEISSPNTPVISMLNDGEYQIETFVSENDIAKLQVNQPVQITLDAYGRDMFFNASVISVDPAETLKDGVSTYRTKIQFIEKDEKVKSGMTANIDIETNRRENIVQIPQLAVVLDSGVKKVHVLRDTSCVSQQATANTSLISPNCAPYLDEDDASLVSIQTGEISTTGDIEILSGIMPGQTIIYSTKAK